MNDYRSNKSLLWDQRRRLSTSVSRWSTRDYLCQREKLHSHTNVWKHIDIFRRVTEVETLITSRDDSENKKNTWCVFVSICRYLMRRRLVMTDINQGACHVDKRKNSASDKSYLIPFQRYRRITLFSATSKTVGYGWCATGGNEADGKSDDCETTSR